ncbi:MAG: EF-hand domain-containing protein [Sphingomicrobium sp.]
MTRNLLIAVLATAAAVPLMAQATPGPVIHVAPVTSPMRMKMADKVITRAEVQAMVQAHFARIDTNHDGFITKAEMEAAHANMKMGDHAMGERGMGQHGMGDHAMRDPNAAFDRLDTNKDGMISRDEFAKGRELRIEQRVVINDGKMPMGEGMRMHGKGGMGGMGGMGMMMGGMMKMADANKDGRVSLQEATAAALQRFDRADTNHDGRLTPDERRAAHQMMIQMRKAG